MLCKDCSRSHQSPSRYKSSYPLSSNFMKKIYFVDRMKRAGWKEKPDGTLHNPHLKAYFDSIRKNECCEKNLIDAGRCPVCHKNV